MHSTDELFRAADPAAGRPVMGRAESEALLERVLTTQEERPVPRRPRRRRVAAAVAAAMTAAAVIVGIGLTDGPGERPAYAATPKPLRLQQDTGVDASKVLADIAERTEKLPAPAHEPGATAHFKRNMWSLNTRVDGEQVTSRVVPQHYESWVGPRGKTKQTVEEAGDSRTNTTRLPVDEAPHLDSPDAEAMKKWVLAIGDGKGTGAFFARYQEKALDHVFTPVQRASLLRALGSYPGVRYNGTVVDRAGRAGAAFSVMSHFGGLPSRQTVIIDRETGKLLAYEEMLTSDPGKLNVKVPAVVEYVTFLEAGYLNG